MQNSYSCPLSLFALKMPPFISLIEKAFVEHINQGWSKVKVGVLRPVQQPGSYWDRSSALPLVGLEPTEMTAYD